ncbi:hypothetical protein V6N12_050810 [Hibiscus sabdariffa]|uniref:Uncharacterized protein n=1 Tax=Hibiscus sabdariffa TaxID=183260 RepID=A0ABR2GDW6_9ROSI
MEYFQNEDLEYVVDDFYNLDDFEHDDPFAGASRFQTVFFFFYLFQIFYVPHLRHQDGGTITVVFDDGLMAMGKEALLLCIRDSLAKGWKRIAYKWRREVLIANFVSRHG